MIKNLPPIKTHFRIQAEVYPYHDNNPNMHFDNPRGVEEKMAGDTLVIDYLAEG